jgi:UDP-N-acetylglucosamine--N-acetylmuramyl-(pentapeptide) pyrophosphoryl-undecaprenol N-acetylglucosamine transferase
LRKILNKLKIEFTKRDFVTIVTFFSSPIGLGHATRDIAIAQHLESISKLFVSGTSATELFKKYGYNVKNLYTPHQFDVQNGSLVSPLKWLWKYYNYYKDCKIISSDIIKNEKPELVISDEDFASLKIAQEQKIPTILITDILQTRFTKGIGSLIEKRMNMVMKQIMKKCDVMILPEYGQDKENIRYVGPIVRTSRHTREVLREKFSFTKKTIVVTCGGTSAGKFLIQKVVEIFSKLKEDVELVIVTGPSLKEEFDGNIRNFGFVENLHEIIYAADLVISLAGKSTIDESKAYGTPGIFIPIKGHFEQEDNAKQEGFSFEDINRLESLIVEKLTTKRNPLKCDGAIRAATIIREFMTEHNNKPNN